LESVRVGQERQMSLESQLAAIRARDAEFDAEASRWRVHVDIGRQPESAADAWDEILSRPVSLALWVAQQTKREAIVRGLNPGELRLVVEIAGTKVGLHFSPMPQPQETM